jgi:ankyrin repeat protein
MPVRVALTDGERDAAERDMLTSEIWREHIGYDPNKADHLLPAGAIRIPLIEYGADYGKVYAVKVALNRGGDPNQASHFYGTVLHVAARNGHLEVVRLLIEQGAMASSFDKAGKTAAQVAEDCGHHAVATYLRSL